MLTGKKQEAFVDLTTKLRELDDLLVDWVARTPAVTDDERRQIRQIMDHRGLLNQALNHLQLATYKGVAKDLAEPRKKLKEVVTQMKQTTADIKKVKDVIALANAAVSIGVQAMAKV